MIIGMDREISTVTQAYFVGVFEKGDVRH